MNNKEFYLNRNLCIEIPTRPSGKYLLKENYLSEFNNESARHKVLTNLGILDRLKELEIGFSGNVEHLTNELAKEVERLSDLDNLLIGWIYEYGDLFLTFSSKENYELYLSNPSKYLDLVLLTILKNNLYVGSEPPENNNYLWIDTNNDTYNPNSRYFYSILKAIQNLQEQVDVLMGMRTRGVISGTIDDGTRTQLIKSSVPIIPDKSIQQLKDALEFGDIDEEDYYSYFDSDVKSGYLTKDVIEKYYNDGYISKSKYDEYFDTIDDIEENGSKPEYPEGEEPTVSHISIKMGTWNLLNSNIRNFINGELIWCTDKTKLYINLNGTLYAIAGGSSITGDDLTMDEQLIKDLIEEKFQNVDSIGFIPVGSDEPKFTAKVNSEGKFIVYENKLDNYNPKPTNNYYYLDTTSATGLVINSFYLGGNYTERDYLPCSHNFVEISNVYDNGKGNGADINLNGFYLLYLGKSSTNWEALPLWGTIPAGGTFLIRGALCSVMEANTTRLKVKDYDMEWYSSNSGKLISFDLTSSVFYLCWGTEDGKFYLLGSDTPVALDLLSVNTNLINTDTKTCAYGYIDLASFNNTNICEKQTYTIDGNAKDVIFRRWYLLDPVTQSNPKDGLDKHNNTKYMSSSFLNGANVNNNIEEFTPKASYQHKSIGTTRTLFDETKPNALTCTFGIQATDNGSGATRGFCWNSVGYFDEYLLIRKQGETEWKKVESVKDELSPSQYVESFPDDISVPNCISNPFYYGYFTRIRWESSYGQSITTHKVLISGLKDTNSSTTEGTKYEYKVIRDNGLIYKDGYSRIEDNYQYLSKIRTFVVKKDSKVDSFNFVLTTDQQGANWEEYEVWNLSARVINREEKNKRIAPYDFIINTGDICYNGSRSNEWLDYFAGYEPLDDKEEMLTVGNNDLAPVSMKDIGNGKESPWKINVGVIDYFYCVEIDTRNPQVFSGLSNEFVQRVTAGKSGEEKQNEIEKLRSNPSAQTLYKIPSMYSFNYGKFHFVSLLSEIRTLSNKETLNDDGSLKDGKSMSLSTVNGIFGIYDELRDSTNKRASKIYDVEEEWIIKDLLLWKGLQIPDNFDRETQRFNPSIVDSCQNCIFFIHEMPFNITSQSIYSSYEGGNDIPRETAKAYLNRYHNYEFLRLFKLWNIRMVIGGHKHTAALTGPVYDAPPGYNPLTKKIKGASKNWPVNDNMLNDKFDEQHTNGMFDQISSVRPFLQVLADDFNSSSGKFRYAELKDYCKEIYNNSTKTLNLDSDATKIEDNYYEISKISFPKVRVEIVDKITAPRYIMCQATGFKNKSNSELAAVKIPWEDFYVDSKSLSQLCYPFFTHYAISPDNIDVKMYRITGLYKADEESQEKGTGAGYWDLNKRYTKNTLEENRDYYAGDSGMCSIELFNQNGTVESPKGSIINLK